MAGDAVTVFFSYSHKDEALRDELANHLKILKLEGVITDWHDRQILPGDEWDREIRESLNLAQIILLLISADFMASQYCWDVEIVRAMERHEAGEAYVIPVILRSCMWSSAPFGKLQALPKNAAPVTSKKDWPTKDEAFTNIAEGIKKAAHDIQQKLKAAKQNKLDQYEATYRQAIQQAYPLHEADQAEINHLQVTLDLTDAEIAPIVTRLSVKYGEARRKLEKYRQEVRHCLKDDGDISDLDRSILEVYRNTFNLTVEEATAVEQEELQPYWAKAEAIAQYEKVFSDAIKGKTSVDKSIRLQLQRLQQHLGLRQVDVDEIEERVLPLGEGDGGKPEPIIDRATIKPPVVPPKVSYKELHECESSKLLFMKNIRDPNGGWSYTFEQIRKMDGSPESRVFEMYWLPTSKGAYAPSKGDLMILNQKAKVTHIVEMLDDEVRATEVGYFRWVRIVWMPDGDNWTQLPHQRAILGFDPPQFGGGTSYSFNSPNFGKFRAAWDSLEAFQQHIFQLLLKHEMLPVGNTNGNNLSSEREIDYSNLQVLLEAGDWKAADQETYGLMLRAMGKKSEVLFSKEELLNFPSTDLLNIDRLWVEHSQGRFGFSIQKRIYTDCGAKPDGDYPGDAVWGRFSDKVGWRVKGEWLYYRDIAFNTAAPFGHLPACVVFLAGWSEGAAFLSHQDL